MEEGEVASTHIADRLAFHAQKTPRRPALLIPRHRLLGLRTHWVSKTFRDLHEEVEGLMRLLREHFHLSKRHRVLLAVRPGHELITGAFALLRLGAIPIIIDAGMGLRRFLSCARKARPDFILGAGRLRWAFGFLRSFEPRPRAIWLTRGFIRSWRRCTASSESPFRRSPGVSVHPNDLAAILFTSGSTGTAKGVRYSHRHLSAQLEALRHNYPLSEDDVDLPLLPIFSLFNPLIGRTSVLPEMDATKPSRLRAKKIIGAIRQHRVTSSFGAPVLWRKIALYGYRHGIQLPDIRFLFLAGVSCDVPTLELLRRVVPQVEIHTPYGATEALPITDICGDELLSRWKVFQENGSGTCVGQPITGAQVRIIRVTEEAIPRWEPALELATGHVGEIIVGGPMVTESYDGEPEKTWLAKIQDGHKLWHRMGDLGFLDQQDRLWFCGRLAERVLVGDEIFYPDCTEPFFLKHPLVARCALIGLRRRGLTLPAIVVQPKLGHYPLWTYQKNRFIGELREIAQRYEKTRRIQHFFFRKKLPVDVRHNAKIHRLALAKRFS
ncbi:MAG: AMP-binding protein [Puniceicoccales bacterium]|jgi:acyl-CoA synthetase (AMP-forming)/AMP-acid ligase II|nr:AMP-binding protein [Puniceicoccales bacterium]